MDLKKEIEVGDYAIYPDSGEVVCDADTKLPIKVITITMRGKKSIVIYENGEYDFLNNVAKCPPVLLELL